MKTKSLPETTGEKRHEEKGERRGGEKKEDKTIGQPAL